MAEKSELKEAAFSLALTELRGRLLYDSFRAGNSSVTAKALKALEAKREEECRRLNDLRRTVPEAAGKSYWWDIPYKIERPAGQFADVYAMPEGIYSEQADFEETFGLRLEESKRRYIVSDILNIYLSFSDYVVLYADRKRLKAAVSAPVTVKAILCCEEELPRQRSVGQYEGPAAVDPKRSYEYRRLESEIRSVSGRLAGELESFDRWHDTAERILNAAAGSPFTDRERWLMGQMDNDSYYTTELYRDYRKMEMREKAREEISRMEYQMEQMRRQAAAADAARKRYEMRRAKANLDRDITMRFMRCGYTFYLGQELVGITAIRRPEMVYQVHHRGTISPYALFGRIGDCRELGFQTPDPGPLIPFILQNYAGRMKPYSPLASRPKNASDELWRYWAEKRFAFLVEENQARV